MIQLIPRVQPFISYGAANTYWTVNSGTVGASLSSTFGPNIARIPLPWSVTVRNLTLYSRDPTISENIVVTVLKNGSDTALAETLPFGSVGPVTNDADDVVYAALDDFSYRATTVFANSNIIGWSLEAESIGNIYGIQPAPGAYADQLGGVGGALGNGQFQSYDNNSPTTRSNSYSICAIPGDLTTLVMKFYGATPIPGGSSWKAHIILNGVVQDGTGGTVDTQCTITAGNTTGTASFTLPLVVGDHVDAACYRTGTTGDFELANVGLGIGFVPDTDGLFMLTGGSNNVVGYPTGYVWIQNLDNATTEALALTPVGPSGLIARALYVERGAPGPGDSFINTFRHNEGPTALSVTIEDEDTSGLIEDQFEQCDDGDTIDMESFASDGASNNSRLFWGVAASVIGAGPEPPDVGTLIVTKQAGADDTTPFTIDVGGGLSPASPVLAGGESQVYADVPVGSGYSVAEPVVPDGWVLSSITVSNDSPADNITIGGGETVTVTVLNQIAPALTTTYPIRRLRRAPHLSREQLVQFFSFFQLDIQAGVGTTTGQGADPQIMLRWSDDGGFTWSHEHWVSAGRIGQYSRRAIWRKLGRGRDRVFEISMTDPVLWVLLDAYLQVEPGTS